MVMLAASALPYFLDKSPSSRGVEITNNDIRACGELAAAHSNDGGIAFTMLGPFPEEALAKA